MSTAAVIGYDPLRDKSYRATSLDTRDVLADLAVIEGRA